MAKTPKGKGGRKSNRPLDRTETPRGGGKVNTNVPRVPRHQGR